MASRGMKRKRYNEMKNDLSVELHKLTLSSGDFNNDFQTANEDFKQMCKSMEDRQSDFLTRALLLEESYGAAMAVLDGKKPESGVESSGENVVLPAGYSEDVRKFVSDANVSLKSHGKFLEEEFQQMETTFQKYGQVWNQKMKELRVRGEEIDKQRSKLSTKLSEFNHFVSVDSGSD